MMLAPPPAPGSRIQELGDTTIVRFRPRRRWGVLAFLVVWLLGWLAGAIAAAAGFVDAPWGGRAFLLVWLSLWLVGGIVAIADIAWQLGGRELLVVTPQELQVRREIGRLSRTKRYAREFVGDISAARVPADEGERPRSDFGLEIRYGDERIPVGEGLGEREARDLAAALQARVHPRPRWNGARFGGDFGFPESVRAPEPAAEPAPVVAAPAPRSQTSVPPVLFVAAAAGAVAIALAAAALAPYLGEGARKSGSRSPVATVPLEHLGSADDRAAALTAIALRRLDLLATRRPECPEPVTWTKWSCTVLTRPLSAGESRPLRMYVCALDARDVAPAQIAVRAVRCERLSRNA